MNNDYKIPIEKKREMYRQNQSTIRRFFEETGSFYDKPILSRKHFNKFLPIGHFTRRFMNNSDKDLHLVACKTSVNTIL